MPGRLVERGSDHTGTVHLLGGETTGIGRDDDNTLVIVDGGISRHHAEVQWRGTQCVLVDLSSKNGTWLNGERLTAPQPLRPGDVITLPCQPPLQLVFEEGSETVTVALDDVGAALKPTPTTAPTTNGGDLRVDTRTGEVWVSDRQVRLTAKEYLALLAFHKSHGALVSKQQLAAEVWPEYEGAVGDENIEQLIYRLRRKLELDPEHPRYLITVRGLGYRLITP